MNPFTPEPGGAPFGGASARLSGREPAGAADGARPAGPPPPTPPPRPPRGFSRRIATRLTLAFLLVILLTGTVAGIVGVWVIGERVLAEAQATVRNDLNVAREIYLERLGRIRDVVRFTGQSVFLRKALSEGNLAEAAQELQAIRRREGLEVLTVLDARGRVVFRASNPGAAGDARGDDPLFRQVLQVRKPVAGTEIVAAEDLRRESPELAWKAYTKFIGTPRALRTDQTEETAGMMLMAAAPVFDLEGNLVGAITGGILLNRNHEIVDKIKTTVFQGVTYKGKDIGTATIFQGPVRISTNVLNENGSRAVGTLISEEVHRQVTAGSPWIGRAFVVSDWYLSSYEPIRDVSGRIVGALYVGILERKYSDLRRDAVLLFLGITLVAALAAMALALLISRRIHGPLRTLVAASGEIGRGNLDVRVDIRTRDELHDLAETFNGMAEALKERDERLKDYARRKIMESERLALIGQLAAGVAHELNNPLQGIVTYSHLLLEGSATDPKTRDFLGKIATQADRCSKIVRGLLDFARQRKPVKTPCRVNSVLQDCVALVENQSLFHNIEIERRFSGGLPPVEMDPSQMQQVFMNLLINAAEAIEGSGRILLATRLNGGGRIAEIEFTDTGQGVRPEDLERIFDPFFTTKEKRHGTGLGLAISHGILREHGGTIAVQSEPGRGTTFTIRLPVHADAGEAAHA